MLGECKVETREKQHNTTVINSSDLSLCHFVPSVYISGILTGIVFVRIDTFEADAVLCGLL